MGILEIGLTVLAWRRGWKSWSLLPLGVGIILIIFVSFVLHDVGALTIYVKSIEGFILIELVVIAVLIFMVARPKKNLLANKSSVAQDSISDNRDIANNLDTVISSSSTRAALVLPNGKQIDIGQTVTPIGRSNFEGLLSPATLDFISRQHFWLRSDKGKYYIEDYLSANGTKLNGNDIKGKGLHRLYDKDKIDIGGVTVAIFTIFNSQ